MMESDAVAGAQKEAIRRALREQFLEYADGNVRMLRQEYKFRYGDTVRRRSDGLQARISQAYKDGPTVAECEDWSGQIFVDEWDLVPVEPKFKVGDKVIWKNDADKGSAYAYTILGIDMAERCYKIGEFQGIGFNNQDEYELFETHVDLSEANTQTRHQLLALKAIQHIEEWFNGLSDEEKEEFAEKYPELVTRDSE